MSKIILLPGGKETIVDDADYEKVSPYRWHRLGGRRSYYASATIKNKDVLLHRLILDAKPGEQIDHINGNKLDNRRENLRLCSHSQNMANRPKHSNNTSGYKGASWDKVRQKFESQIVCKSKKIYLGYFETAVEAAKAYDEAAKKYFGEFANLNFGE